MNIFKLLLLSYVLLNNTCYANYKHFDAVYRSLSNDSLECKLEKLNITISYTNELKKALQFCAVDNYDLILSIVMIESNFKVDAYNDISKDFGLMQINKYHVDKLNLKTDLLLSDVIYNVTTGCNILHWFINTYEFSEAIMRFNVGTAKDAVNSEAAKNYLNRVMKYYNILKGVNNETDKSNED